MSDSFWGKRHWRQYRLLFSSIFHHFVRDRRRKRDHGSYFTTFRSQTVSKGTTCIFLFFHLHAGRRRAIVHCRDYFCRAGFPFDQYTRRGYSASGSLFPHLYRRNIPVRDFQQHHFDFAWRRRVCPSNAVHPDHDCAEHRVRPAFHTRVQWGIEGAARATVISQGIGMYISLAYVNNTHPLLSIKKQDMLFDWELFKKA